MTHFVDDLTAHPALLNRIDTMFDALASYHARVQELDRLSRMTDPQLEALGLKRTDLVTQLFARALEDRTLEDRSQSSAH